MNPRPSRHFGFYKILFGAALAGLLFAGLMAVRLDFFKSSPQPLPTPGPIASTRDTWMTIWQSDRKIGYSHRQLSVMETGYRLEDRTVMRINTMGLVQDINLEITADMNSNLSLSAFEANLTSSRFSFAARGKVVENTLHVFTGNGQLDIPLEGPLHPSAGIWIAAASSALQPGQSLDIPIFDPVSLGSHTIRVTFLGRESVQFPGGQQDARKFRADFMGATETAWIDDRGGVLKEEGLFDITLVRDTRENALNTESLSGSRDLTLAASIPAGTTLKDPGALPRLELKIDGAPPALLLDGGRQSFSGGVLTIVRETLPDPPTISPEEEAEYVSPSAFIQSDHPDILAAAKTAVADAPRPLTRAQNLVRWVHDSLEKRPVLSVPTALETLRQGAGDCNEHAVLLAALARAAGIPARVEAGLVYLDGRFYYHAWNSLFLGEWITADPLMNQLPADVTHIRMVKGTAGEQADLLGAIGRINIRILGEP